MTASSEFDPASTPPSAAITEGSLIGGKYRVERLIGVGGMGIVVSAVHLTLERHVAIKIVREELAREESVLQRFVLEAKAAAQLSNDHVCKVLDVGRLDTGLPFIVMELLQGRDLGGILEERHAVGRIEAVDWMIQACAGLAQAHAVGIVHRDLKPENLFLTQLRDGSACLKILDFGISKQLGRRSAGSITGPLGVVGSPRYMAPEQLLATDVDERSDIWSLGAILYELLTGVPAFAADNLASLCAQVLAATPVPPSEHDAHIPLGLQSALLRCLCREREGRFQNVSQLALALMPYGSELGRRTFERMATPPAPRSLPPSGQPTPIAASIDRTLPLVLRARSYPGYRNVVAVSLTLTVLGLLSLLIVRSAPAGRHLQHAHEPPVLVHDLALSASAAEPVVSNVDSLSETPPAQPSGSNTASSASAPPALARPAKAKPPQPAASEGARPAPDPAAHSPWTPQQAWDIRNFGGRL